MKKLLLVLAASVIASAVSAQGVTAPATGKPAAAPLLAAPADTGVAAKEPDTTKPVTKQRKKARKSTVKLGVKARTVQ
jgi:phosphate-selective porin